MHILYGNSRTLVDYYCTSELKKEPRLIKLLVGFAIVLRENRSFTPNIRNLSIDKTVCTPAEKECILQRVKPAPETSVRKNSVMGEIFPSVCMAYFARAVTLRVPYSKAINSDDFFA